MPSGPELLTCLSVGRSGLSKKGRDRRAGGETDAAVALSHIASTFHSVHLTRPKQAAEEGSKAVGDRRNN